MTELSIACPVIASQVAAPQVPKSKFTPVLQHSGPSNKPQDEYSAYRCTYIMYIYVDTSVHVHVCVYVRMYVCRCVSACVRMYLCL